MPSRCARLVRPCGSSIGLVRGRSMATADDPRIRPNSTKSLRGWRMPATYAPDLWIEPSSFHPTAGERVTAALRVGQKLRGEPLPRIPPLIDRFVLDDKPMLGFAGGDPAGIALVARNGFQWIGYQSNAFPMTLDAPKFEQYLRDEGLDATIKVQSQRPQAERFYRCAKSLIDAGGAPSGTIDAP